jgi:hypothetical protein
VEKILLDIKINICDIKKHVEKILLDITLKTRKNLPRHSITVAWNI